MSFANKLLTTQQLLKHIAAEHASVAFANSLGAEDMVLMDLITKYAPAIEIFSIDTGRLPAETYDLIDRATKHYRRKIKVYFPEQSAVENYVRINGINGFRDSVAQRQDCCHARKVEPLQRALKGKAAWITGLRREQAVTRKNLSASEFDQANGLQKFNPLTIGPRTTFGSTSTNSMCLITRCTIKAIPASAARPAPARFSRAKMCVPDAGGGKAPSKKSAAYM